jgi:hypothetical protein
MTLKSNSVCHMDVATDEVRKASRMRRTPRQGEQHRCERRHTSVGWSANEAGPRSEAVVAGPPAKLDSGAPRTNASTRRRSGRGLIFRGAIWHIDKVLFGKRVCESTRTGDLVEAEVLLAHRMSQARRVHLYGEPAEHTFREAGVKFLCKWILAPAGGALRRMCAGRRFLRDDAQKHPIQSESFVVRSAVKRETSFVSWAAGWAPP